MLLIAVLSLPPPSTKRSHSEIRGTWPSVSTPRCRVRHRDAVDDVGRRAADSHRRRRRRRRRFVTACCSCCCNPNSNPKPYPQSWPWPRSWFLALSSSSSLLRSHDCRTAVAQLGRDTRMSYVIAPPHASRRVSYRWRFRDPRKQLPIYVTTVPWRGRSDECQKCSSTG